MIQRLVHEYMRGKEIRGRVAHFAVALTLLVTLSGISAQAQERKVDKSIVRGDTLYTLLKPGDIPAIFDPQFMSLEEAEKVYHDNEPLIVVTKDGEVKGYSAWHLDGHEVVNDYIGGDAITVTW